MTHGNEQINERLTVRPGDDQDVCPECGIWRVNAGYLRESCGPGYLKDGCFISVATGSSSVPADERTT